MRREGWPGARLHALWLLVATMLLAGLPLSAPAWPAHDGEYLYWSTMPTAQKVRDDEPDAEKVARAASLHAGFTVLQQLVDVHRDGRGTGMRTDRERQLYLAYGEELDDVIRDGREANRASVQQRSLSLQADPAHANAFLQRYFTPAALAEIEPLLVRMRDDAARSETTQLEASEALQRASSVRPFEGAILRAGGRPLFYLLFVVLPVLLVSALALEFLPHGLDRANSTVGRRGLRHYFIGRDTGVVTKTGRGFALRNLDGAERPLPADHIAMDLVAGRRLSVLWAAPGTPKPESALLFRDHETSRSSLDPAAIRALVLPSRWPVALAGGVALMVGTVASDRLFGPDATAVVLLVPPIAMAALGWIVAAWLRMRVGRDRARRFANDLAERAVPELDRRAQIRD